jgi:hypothetical protein
VWEEKFWRKDLVCCIDERDLNNTHIPSLFLIESSYKLTTLQIVHSSFVLYVHFLT